MIYTFLYNFSRAFHYNSIFYSNLVPNTDNYNNCNNNQLGYHLAGLIESDGTLITLAINDKNNRLTIKIVFQMKDKPLAEQLLKTLGYETIQKTNSSNAVALFIRNKKVLLI